MSSIAHVQTLLGSSFHEMSSAFCSDIFSDLHL